MLLAEMTGMDAVAGSSGWVGAGLLGAVLAWVFFVHLPAKDKQAKEKDDNLLRVITEHTTRIREITSAHSEIVKEINEHNNATALEKDKSRRADFREALNVVVSHCQRESQIQTDIMRTEMVQQTEAIMQVLRGLEEFREEQYRPKSRRTMLQRPGDEKKA